jgi:hypothetical protein
MKKSHETGRRTLSDRTQGILERTRAGRLINMMKFIIVIIFLGFWVAWFLAVKDQLFKGHFIEPAATDLTCITFFGGLIISLILGSIAGDIVRRLFWRLLIKYRK